MKRQVFLPILFLIIALFLTQALISNFASAEGVDLALTRQEAKRLEKENQALETKIITSSSLAEVSLVAAALGFCPAKTVYTSFDLPVAMGN